MSVQYSKKVLDHFMNPHNLGTMDNPDISATEGSPACGDQITLQLKIDPMTKVIEDIKFRSYGCASNIATASIITDLAKGKTLEEAKKINWKDAAEALDGLPPIKMHCSVLAVDTLQKAIREYEVKNKLTKIEAFSKETVLRELKSIIYPKVGDDIITLKMVKYAGYKDGVVTIDLDIPKFDDYRENVAQEIREHLEKYSDVKDIKITM